MFDSAVWRLLMQKREGWPWPLEVWWAMTGWPVSPVFFVVTPGTALTFSCATFAAGGLTGIVAPFPRRAYLQTTVLSGFVFSAERESHLPCLIP